MDQGQMMENLKKQNRYMKITMYCMVGVLAITILSFILIVPQLVFSMGEISKMSDSITTTSDSINVFIEEHSQMISETVEQFNEIDYDSLNQAIQNLRDTVEPFADFMNRFK